MTQPINIEVIPASEVAKLVILGPKWTSELHMRLYEALRVLRPDEALRVTYDTVGCGKGDIKKLRDRIRQGCLLRGFHRHFRMGIDCFYVTCERITVAYEGQAHYRRVPTSCGHPMPKYL